MNLFMTILLTIVSVGVGTVLCFWLIYHALEVDSPTWILEHVVCPIIRIVVLLVVVSQIYPVIQGDFEFWKQLGQRGLFTDLINVLFFAGLLLSFLPFVSHPVFALPIQSILTIAVIFNSHYAHLGDSLQLVPSLGTSAKIFAYMALAYYLTRESSIYLSRILDRRLHIAGSIRLVSDATYLVLQIPVMLLYCNFLRHQLPT